VVQRWIATENVLLIALLPSGPFHSISHTLVGGKTGIRFDQAGGEKGLHLPLSSLGIPNCMVFIFRDRIPAFSIWQNNSLSFLFRPWKARGKERII